MKASRKRAADFRQEPPAKFQQKGDNKGAGKSKKGKRQRGKSGSSATPGCKSTTPDGRPICYRYNNKSERCNTGKCTFAHVCGVCFAKDVPMWSCNCARKGGAGKPA